MKTSLLLSLAVGLATPCTSFPWFSTRALAAQDDATMGGNLPALGTLNGDRVRIRTGPSTNHFAFTHLSRGDEVLVMAQEGDWCRLQLPAYRTCWIHGDFVTPQPGGGYLVTGSNVRVRGTPGTAHQLLGVVQRNQKLVGTGKQDTSATWVEIVAPVGMNAYIHKDYLRLLRRVSAAECSTLFAGLREGSRDRVSRPVAGVGSSDPGETPGTAARGDRRGEEEFPMPSTISARLRGLHEAIQNQRKKPPLKWDFDGIVADLEKIRDTSEDLGEIRVSNEFLKLIQDHLLPSQQIVVDLERKQEQARQVLEAGQRREQEVPKAVHRQPADRDQEYLAIGWVVAMGKHRKANCTHKLTKGNKTLYYLRSDEINLNQYVNKRVGIVGTVHPLPPEVGAHQVVVTATRVFSD